MDNDQVQYILNKLLDLNPLDKNNFYHTILSIIRKNNTDEKHMASEIIIAFDEILANKRIQLDGMLNGDPSAGKSNVSGKSSPIFRRVT
jgi:hypothetical protein